MSLSRAREHLLGVISDTHGLVRPQALAGVERILHAGDIGSPDVLDALRAVAPVVAVRGNNDRGAWAERLPDTEHLALGGARIHLLHDLKELACDPVAERLTVVIAGHTHRPRIEERDGVLYVNPGSAGPRRFKLPLTVGRLRVMAGQVQAEIVQLELGG